MNEFQQVAQGSQIGLIGENADALDAAERAVAEGKFVVLCRMPAHCRFTDGLIGTRHVVLATCDSREGAEAKADAMDDGDHESETYILPRLPAECVSTKPAACEDDDIPF